MFRFLFGTSYRDDDGWALLAQCVDRSGFARHSTRDPSGFDGPALVRWMLGAPKPPDVILYDGKQYLRTRALDRSGDFRVYAETSATLSEDSVVYDAGGPLDY